MSLSTSTEKELSDLTRKVGLLKRDRPGKKGNAFEWFSKLEGILRAQSVYYVVEPSDKREGAKRQLLLTIAGSCAFRAN